MTTESGGRSVTLQLPSVRALVTAILSIVLIAGSIVAGVRTHNLAVKKDRLEHQLSSFDQSALAAARSYAITFATYSYADLDANFAATEAHAVDPFLSQYRSTIDQLRASLTASKATSTAKVLSAGLASVTATTAVVDLFLDQSIVNTQGASVKPQRVEMTLVRQHGEWLISKVVLP